MSTVVSVNRCSSHSFSKESSTEMRLIAGQGVEGDVHSGETVQHLSRIKADPAKPNLRQVHLISQELIEELKEKGYHVKPGSMGENITTIGIDLLSLPTKTLLKIGPEAVVEVTGLRNPCNQLDKFQEGLKQAVLDKDAEGNIIRRAGIMSVVVSTGVVKPGDSIEANYPEPPHEKLEVV